MTCNACGTNLVAVQAERNEVGELWIIIRCFECGAVYKYIKEDGIKANTYCEVK